MTRATATLTAALLTLTPVFAGAATAQRQASPLTIYAAASLTEAFDTYDPVQRYSFAGSNQLATQIKNGAPADIFASADPLDIQRLFSARVVERPVAFAGNRIALIVPKANPAGITSVSDLRTKPARLVIASSAVPVGRYTRAVLKRMGMTSVLSSVVSQEPDVKAVTGKVALGQADAGFVYATDARAVAGKVTMISVPSWAQPRIRYEIAVVSRSRRATAARAWIRGLLSAKGQAALAKAGLVPLPKGSS